MSEDEKDHMRRAKKKRNTAEESRGKKNNLK
jgi:hypothetical protein